MNKAAGLLAVAITFGTTSLARAEEPAVLPPSTGCGTCTITKTCCPVSRCEALRHRLCDWLTYQPLQQPGPCGCWHREPYCCRPPLYAFFLGNCAGSSGCGASASAPCTAPGSCAPCASRKPWIEWQHPLIKPFRKSCPAAEAVPDCPVPQK